MDMGTAMVANTSTKSHAEAGIGAA